MKVLIVDDEDGIRDTLRDAFEDEGYAVAVAADGIEALQQLATVEKPCAVILDLVMPEMDGNQVWDAMQADPDLAAIPVVITTSDPSRAPRGILTMRKPVDLGLLIATVGMFCGRSQASSGEPG
jgi:CheY-like chemotaxis protein